MSFKITVVAETARGRYVGSPIQEPITTLEALADELKAVQNKILLGRPVMLYDLAGTLTVLGASLVTNSAFTITDNSDEVQP